MARSRAQSPDAPAGIGVAPPLHTHPRVRVRPMPPSFVKASWAASGLSKSPTLQPWIPVGSTAFVHDVKQLRWREVGEFSLGYRIHQPLNRNLHSCGLMPLQAFSLHQCLQSLFSCDPQASLLWSSHSLSSISCQHLMPLPGFSHLHVSV